MAISPHVMGTPTDCVYLGVNALMRPRPDIVVSGINAGPNLGDDADLFRYCPRRRSPSRLSGGQRPPNGYQHYDTAAAVTCALASG